MLCEDNWKNENRTLKIQGWRSIFGQRLYFSIGANTISQSRGFGKRAECRKFKPARSGPNVDRLCKPARESGAWIHESPGGRRIQATEELRFIHRIPNDRYHRRRRGPNFAPMKAHNAISPPYQIARNGRKSSGQWNA